MHFQQVVTALVLLLVSVITACAQGSHDRKGDYNEVLGALETRQHVDQFVSDLQTRIDSDESLTVSEIEEILQAPAKLGQGKHYAYYDRQSGEKKSISHSGYTWRMEREWCLGADAFVVTYMHCYTTTYYFTFVFDNNNRRAEGESKAYHLDYRYVLDELSSQTEGNTKQALLDAVAIATQLYFLKIASSIDESVKSIDSSVADIRDNSDDMADDVGTTVGIIERRDGQIDDVIDDVESRR